MVAPVFNKHIILNSCVNWLGNGRIAEIKGFLSVLSDETRRLSWNLFIYKKRQFQKYFELSNVYANKLPLQLDSESIAIAKS